MISTLLRRFLFHRGGVAFIEFAMVFPVFFLLLFGGIEINRLILIQQKLEKAGYVISDIVTRYQPATLLGAVGEISVAELNANVFSQLPRMMGTYSDPPRQIAIITSLRISGGLPRTVRIDWQIAGGGGLTGGTCDGLTPDTCATSIVNGLAPSAITAAVRGTTVTLPSPEAGFVDALPTADNQYTLVVSEVFYFYQPLLGTLIEDVGSAGGTGFAGFKFFLKPKIYVKRTYFIPRVNQVLHHLPPTFPCCLM